MKQPEHIIPILSQMSPSFLDIMRENSKVRDVIIFRNTLQECCKPTYASAVTDPIIVIGAFDRWQIIPGRSWVHREQTFQCNLCVPGTSVAISFAPSFSMKKTQSVDGIKLYTKMVILSDDRKIYQQYTKSEIGRIAMLHSPNAGDAPDVNSALVQHSVVRFT